MLRTDVNNLAINCTGQVIVSSSTVTRIVTDRTVTDGNAIAIFHPSVRPSVVRLFVRPFVSTLSSESTDR